MTVPREYDSNVVAERIRRGTGYVPVFASGEALMASDFSRPVVEAALSRVGDCDLRYNGITIGDWIRIYLDLAGVMPLESKGTLAASVRDNLRRDLDSGNDGR